ncbi:MAG TPA: hypothetical protein VFG66_06390 [Gemmatimonadales bacterium]|nr:hypothetical protein [Gemmatimonadales bacterium]
MPDEPRSPENTREFVAMWNSATADHLAHKLSEILRQLARRQPNVSALDETQAAALSPLLIRALQVAASPEGGVHAAVQFLGEYAAEKAT